MKTMMHRDNYLLLSTIVSDFHHSRTTFWQFTQTFKHISDLRREKKVTVTLKKQVTYIRRLRHKKYSTVQMLTA